MTVVNSRLPRVNSTLNPTVNSALNPLYNSALNPLYNSTINPLYNSALNPLYNSSVNPLYNSAINPLYNSAINPRYNSAINPRYNSSINPEMTSNIVGLYLFDWETLGLSGFAVKANGNVYVVFDLQQRLSGIVSRATNTVFVWHDEKGNYLGQWVFIQENTFLLYDASTKVVGLTT